MIKILKEDNENYRFETKLWYDFSPNIRTTMGSLHNSGEIYWSDFYLDPKRVDEFVNQLKEHGYRSLGEQIFPSGARYRFKNRDSGKYITLTFLISNLEVSVEVSKQSEADYKSARELTKKLQGKN